MFEFSAEQDCFDVKKYVADYLNGRRDRVVVGEFAKSTNLNHPDRVVSWTRDALTNLKQQLASARSNNSQHNQLRVFFELIPEFNRNMRAVLEALSSTEREEKNGDNINNSRTSLWNGLPIGRTTNSNLLA